MSSNKIDLRGLSKSEMEKFFENLGEPKFRATQVMEWIHGKGVSSFDEMTNLPKDLRMKLGDVAQISPLIILKKQVSKIDGTRKYLFKLHDGNTIESVLMFHDYGISVCLSTQVGCKMGCGFCATAIGGFKRNLSAGEIISQAITISRDLTEENERISSVVLMGMGEPLDNYDNSIKAIRLLNLPQGLNIGNRRITISTCGLIHGIRRLSEEGLPITLAISLHAPNDRLRTKLMPINRRYPLKELLKVCKEYIQKTKRRVTFEYALIKGVNDSKGAARELVTILRGMLCHVNLIPINAVRERKYEPTERSQVNEFLRELEQGGISATIRRGMGADIHGACGQLRKRELKER